MPGFKIHISGSTVLGIGYGAGAYVLHDAPLESCVLATGLCSVSGMLPDLDSGPGIPLRESLCFAAAFVPMLLYDRARQLGWTHETMVLAGAALYVTIRFGFGHLLRHHSVHRGMFHSIPTCLIFAGLAFLLCNTGTLPQRYYKAGAVVVGFMSHLILDEIWSVEWRGLSPHLKKSFGTAVKFWSPCMWSTLLTYGLFAAVAVLVLNDPIWAGLSPRDRELHQVAADMIDDAEPVEQDLENAAANAIKRVKRK